MKEGVLGATFDWVVREGFSQMSVELCQNERRGQMCADVGVTIADVGVTIPAEGTSSAKAA